MVSQFPPLHPLLRGKDTCQMSPHSSFTDLQHPLMCIIQVMWENGESGDVGILSLVLPTMAMDQVDLHVHHCSRSSLLGRACLSA